MFQEWKTSILRHAKFWSGNGEGYLGVSQDDDSSPVAANEIGAEKTSTRTRRLHMGGYALTAIIGMLLGSFLGGVVLTTPRSCQKTIAEAVMTDSPEDLLPKLGLDKAVIFQPDYSYWNISNASSEEAWKALGRNGNIFVKNPERFGLEPGIEQSGDYDGFPISVFHQLHCLNRLREGLAALSHGSEYIDTVTNHADHCFDYLRQAIMCKADMTLEKARVDEDGHRRATDGWGTAHHCANWEEVMRIKADYLYKYAI